MKRCILDTPSARYNHMTYLKQRRDQVVRDGSRSGRVAPSLMSTCRGYHGEQSQFCDKCHERAGVRLGCHNQIVTIGLCCFPALPEPKVGSGSIRLERVAGALAAPRQNCADARQMSLNRYEFVLTEYGLTDVRENAPYND